VRLLDASKVDVMEQCSHAPNGLFGLRSRNCCGDRHGWFLGGEHRPPVRRHLTDPAKTQHPLDTLHRELPTPGKAGDEVS
jgi:hypothetical protein